ncbi:MAG: hypothetical protein ABL949_06220 [Fimbriimonadaceae bacterium]
MSCAKSLDKFKADLVRAFRLGPNWTCLTGSEIDDLERLSLELSGLMITRPIITLKVLGLLMLIVVNDQHELSFRHEIAESVITFLYEFEGTSVGYDHPDLESERLEPLSKREYLNFQMIIVIREFLEMCKKLGVTSATLNDVAEIWSEGYENPWKSPTTENSR